MPCTGKRSSGCCGPSAGSVEEILGPGGFVARRTNSRLGCLEPLDPACSIGLSMCLSGVTAQGLWGPTGERLRAIQKRWGDSLHL